MEQLRSTYDSSHSHTTRVWGRLMPHLHCLRFLAASSWRTKRLGHAARSTHCISHGRLEPCIITCTTSEDAVRADVGSQIPGTWQPKAPMQKTETGGLT